MRCYHEKIGRIYFAHMHAFQLAEIYNINSKEYVESLLFMFRSIFGIALATFAWSYIQEEMSI